MALERYVRIKVDTSDADSKIKTLDSNVNALGNTSKAAASKVNTLETSVKKTTTAVRQATKATADTTKATANFGRRAGMAGVQIEQLVGSINAGQNPLRAFGFQAADLGIVLGAPLVGAIVGVSASIASVLVPSLLDATSDTENLEKAVQDFINKLKEADNLSKDTFKQVEIDKLTTKANVLRDSIDKTTRSIKELSTGFQSDATSKQLIGATTELANLEKQLTLVTEQQAALFDEGIAQLKFGEIDTKQVQDDFRELQQLSQAFYSSELDLIFDNFDKRNSLADDALRQRLQISQAASDRELRIFFDGFKTQEQIEADSLRNQQQIAQSFYDAELDAITANFEKKNALAQVGWQDYANIASSAIQSIGQISANGVQSDITNIEKSRDARLALAKTEEERVQISLEAESKINAFRKKAFEDKKKADILAAGINTAVAYTKALADTANPIYANAILGLGAIQVAAIESTRYGGSASTSSSSGVSTSSSGTQGDINRSIATENLALTQLKDELSRFDPDEPLPVSFTTRIVNALENQEVIGGGR